jgi:hypothetical protein
MSESKTPEILDNDNTPYQGLYEEDISKYKRVLAYIEDLNKDWNDGKRKLSTEEGLEYLDFVDEHMDYIETIRSKINHIYKLAKDLPQKQRVSYANDMHSSIRSVLDDVFLKLVLEPVPEAEHFEHEISFLGLATPKVD